ncbi:MAG: hypothetical protein ABIC82_05770 [bacterium]
MNNELMLQFADQVLKKAGLNLQGDFLVEYRERLLGEIEKRIWLMTVNELKDNKIMEFAEIIGGFDEMNDDIDEKQKREIADFCKKNISDFEEKVLKVMDDFGNEFVSDVAKMEKM